MVYTSALNIKIPSNVYNDNKGIKMNWSDFGSVLLQSLGKTAASAAQARLNSLIASKINPAPAAQVYSPPAQYPAPVVLTPATPTTLATYKPFMLAAGAALVLGAAFWVSKK